MWPWSWLMMRRRWMLGRLVDTPTDDTDHGAALNEARAARAHSEAAVDEAVAKREEIHEVAERLRGARQSNHFAERMGDTFRRRGRW